MIDISCGPGRFVAWFAEADIVLLNGGSSKGEEDLNARMLEARGRWPATA